MDSDEADEEGGPAGVVAPNTKLYIQAAKKVQQQRPSKRLPPTRGNARSNYSLGER